MRLEVLLLGALIALFGCSSDDTDQNILFVTMTEDAKITEVQRVPLVIGQAYGWILKVKDEDVVVWKEEFTLPSVPKVWGEKDAISNINVVEKSEQPFKSDIFGPEYFGFVTNMWSVAEGDSAGMYNFKISQNDKLVKEFDIEFYEQ